MSEPNGHHSAVESETTTLVSGSSGQETPNYGTVEQTSEDLRPAKPDDYLNRKQILLLAYCRMIDPVAFFCIVPFINQMIFDLNEYPESDIGFYSGLIESLFSLVQMLLLVPWGRLADTVGRKPVMIASLSGLLVTVTLFGFCKTLWQMILLRCLSGVFSGSVVAVRAMITENSAPKTQAKAFSLFAFFGNVGIFLGVLLGGFADPAKQYPKVFGNIKFFLDYPYAAPTIVSGILVLSALFVTIFFVEETLEKGKAQDTRHGAAMSTLEVLKSPGVPNVLFIYVLAGVLGFGFTAVAPVFWFTSVEKGGFGLTPRIISYFMALGGVSQALWMLVVFPPFQGRVGTGGVLRACAIVWPISFALNPLANVVLKYHLDTVFWVAAPFAIIISSGCAMAFTGVQLIVNDISPTPAALGTLNGIALSMQSATRAFTPALFTSIYAKGVRDQILWGQFGWVFLIAVTFVYGASLFWLPAKAEGRYREVPQEEPSEE